MGTAIVFVAGLLVASFLMLAGSRIPRGEDIVRTRSHCDFCGRTLSWVELIPVFSYAVQRGRCRSCGRRLSPAYPIGEVLVGLSWALIFMRSESAPALIFELAVFSLLFVIIVSDLEHYTIPDGVLVLMAVCTLGYGLVAGVSLADAAVHAISGIGASLFFYAIWAGTRGKGMGFGDVKLAFVLGILLGFPGIIMSLYISFILGAAVSVLLILFFGKTGKSRVPFGPFLVLGAYLAHFFRTDLMILWQGYLGGF